MKRLVTFFIFLIVSVAAFAQARQKVAVLDFRTESLEAVEYVRRASDVFSMNFNNPFAVDVVSSSRFVSEAAAKGYDVASLTENQVMAVGKAMGLNDVITCTISYDGSGFIMQMRMLSMLTQTVKHMDTATWPSGGSCVEPVKALAERMLAALSKPETTSVSAPSQAAPAAPQPQTQNISVQQHQLNVSAAPDNDVVVLYGFLAVFPEDIGQYSSIPNFVIAGVNADNTYGRSDWRVPTSEEMSLILASSAKLKNIRKDVQYLTSDGNTSGVLRLVANLNDSAVQQPAPQQSYQQPVPQPAYQQPVQEPVYQQPVPQQTYQQPYQQPTPQPVPQQSYQQPVPQPVQQPVPQPVQEPAYQQPVQETAYQQPAPQPAPQPAAPAVPDTGFYDGRLVIKGIEYPMVYVAGGTFTMGNDLFSDQKPSHQVTLTGYYIGKFEVSQALWVAVMGNNPCPVEDDALPVESISWEECQQFVKILSDMTGKQVNLPTEAQWEFAAKGGNFSKGYEFSGSDNHGEVAWNGSNSGGESHKMGLLKPNELGLHDMSGNVMEWCADYYGTYNAEPQTNPTGPAEGYTRVVRGGCWHNTYVFGKVDYRSNVHQSSKSGNLGFRIVVM